MSGLGAIAVSGVLAGQAAASRQHRCLCPVAKAEAPEETTETRLDRAFRAVFLDCDLLV